MAARQQCQSFTAGRPVRLDGVDYAVGDTIPNTVIGKVKHVTALISRRIIVPSSDTYGRPLKVPMRTGPFRLFARERKEYAEGKVIPTPRTNTSSTEPK